MKIIEKTGEKANNLKRDIIAVYYAYQNPEVKMLPRIIAIFAIGYALSPIDLIPDFIPVLGYLDDLIIIPALISLSIKLIPEKIMNESREKALREPVKLKKNLFFALLFILIWLALITAVASAIIRLFIMQ
jgi:uncharacterized membrane protein YkvA (DUF1232 family)